MLIQTQILQEIIPTTIYLPEDQDFKEIGNIAESGNMGEKIAGFLKIINLETFGEPMYVCQYQKMYHKTELNKK